MVRFAVGAFALRRAGIAARNRTTQTQFRVSQVDILDVCISPISFPCSPYVNVPFLML